MRRGGSSEPNEPPPGSTMVSYRVVPLVLECHRRFAGERVGDVLRRDVARVVDGGAEPDGVLAAEQAEQQPDDVAGQRAVRVRPAQVDDGHELRKQDHVDEVAAQVPQLVDGVDHDAHHHRQHAHAEYADPHHPDDLALRSLERQDRRLQEELEMWANDQRDGQPAEYRWRPLFNAAKFG